MSSIAPTLVAQREEMQNCSKRHNQPQSLFVTVRWPVFIAPKKDIPCHRLPGCFISFTNIYGSKYPPFFSSWEGISEQTAENINSCPRE